MKQSKATVLLKTFCSLYCKAYPHLIFVVAVCKEICLIGCCVKGIKMNVLSGLRTRKVKN